MAKRKSANSYVAQIEAALQRIRSLDDEPSDDRRRAVVIKGLRDSSALVVQEAARQCRELSISGCRDELLASYRRLLVDPSDPQPKPAIVDKGCFAKTEILQALRTFEFDDPDFYLEGMRYCQYEPDLQGPRETAVNLRGECAFAVAASWRIGTNEKLFRFVELFHFQPGCLQTPAIAVQAIGATGAEAAIPLLRLLLGLPGLRGNVYGACAAGLLRLDPAAALPLVSKLLHSDRNDVIVEAMAALGESRRPDALAMLVDRWRKPLKPELKAALLASVGLSRLPAAVDFLVEVIASNSQDSELAVEAAGPLFVYPDFAVKLREAVMETKSARLIDLMSK